MILMSVPTGPLVGVNLVIYGVTRKASPFPCDRARDPPCFFYCFPRLLWILVVDSRIFGRVIHVMYVLRGITMTNTKFSALSSNDGTGCRWLAGVA